ncbi:MOB kinase activator family protein [Kipferlia bialata]|uniref:MOB kinase activator family protein n=1 Tax=Kipferlia bialata TaxID=797122 RepID=A0A9K3D9P5_9EUKA|nr:MOB kinase activator family protein [Kipferlia bialata]|eukprot:g14328.t1
MTAGPKYEYRWADGEQYRTPVACSAPEYVEFLFTWVQKQINNEGLFPYKPGVPFPRNFQSIVKTIFKRLFRVYAHVYHCHWAQVVSLGAEAHLNTCTKHFIFFVKEFDLIDDLSLSLSLSL